MKRNFFIILLSLLFLTFFNGKPISETDRHLSILYVCSIEGRFEFDEDGRDGLATISELKRRELQKIYTEKGGVLLLSRGAFFENSEDPSSFHLLKKGLFDGVIVSEEEISYLEKNPALKKLGLPVISPRDNLLGMDTEKIYDLDGIHIKVNSYLINKLPFEVTKHIHINLVFPDPKEPISLEDINPKIPVIFFLPKDKTTNYSFKRNVYTAECPEKKGVVGNIHLYYRDGKLIRQKQEFISLNKKDTNQNWIRPSEEVLKELNR